VVGVVVHDVPEDRTTPDLDHRLGVDLGFLDQSSSDAARKKSDLHALFISLSGVVIGCWASASWPARSWPGSRCPARTTSARCSSCRTGPGPGWRCRPG